jgi:hypothetical protein
MRMSRWLARAASSVVASLLLGGSVTGCQSQASNTAANQAKDQAALATLLRAADTPAFYAFQGEKAQFLDLWKYSLQTRGQAGLSARPSLYSMLSSVGRDVVMTASSPQGGQMGDGLLWLDGATLKPVTSPITDTIYEPDLSVSGQLVAVSADRSQAITTSILQAGPFKKGAWTPRILLRAEHIWSPVWGPDGQIAVKTGDLANGQQRLALMEKGKEPRDLGPGGCTTSTIWGVGNRIAAGFVLESEGANRSATCKDAFVVDIATKKRESLPSGWNPLLWSKDGSRLIVTKGHELGLWTPGTTTVTDTVTTSVRIWDLVPVAATAP